MSGEAVATEVPAEVRKMVGFIEARAARNDALRATDWTQMADAPLTALEKTAYQAYRQALRDLPGLPGFPDVPWPALPTVKDGAASDSDPSASL
ncbi:tail fiber assembly protein [Stenotrophomonas sepilia]